MWLKCLNFAAVIPKLHIMNTPTNFYRIKMSWLHTNAEGKEEKLKTEDLVEATCYTEAEKIAHALVREQQRDAIQEPEYEIVKTKVEYLRMSNILQVDGPLQSLMYAYFNDAEGCTDGLYSVKVRYEEGLNDKGDRTFRTKTVWVIARSSDHAKDLAERRYDGLGPIVREIKFDPTESIIVPKSFIESEPES